jgi:hypothetical protein
MYLDQLCSYKREIEERNRKEKFDILFDTREKIQKK